MRYYKVTENNVLKRIGTGLGGEEISKTEYDALYAEIMESAKNAEPEEPVEEDLTAEEALAIILGGEA